MNPASAKKKILFVITKATWGGAQKYVYDLATHLPKDRFCAVVAYGQRGKLAEDLSAAGIETHEIPAMRRDVSPLSDIGSFFAILRYVRETRPDVVHLNSSKAAGLGALAARLCGVKTIIFTAHGWPFNERRSSLARGLIYFLSWLTALISDTVILVSRSDEAQGRRMRFVAKKIRYIPIGIDPPRFLTREEAENKFGFTKSKFTRIVTIAELTKNKGVRYAIEAIALLKARGADVEYFIIGEGEERAALSRLAFERGVAERVHFLGFVQNAAQYLRAFDLFILPSIKEGMPYVLLEAAAAGVPVICTDVVDPMFFDLSLFTVKKVVPGDAVAIADALVESLQSTSKPLDISSPLAEMVERTARLY